MPKPVNVKPRPDYCLWLRYEDGADGVVDLSDLAGRGVFKAWEDAAFFKTVRIGAHGSLTWGETIDLCPDALYMRLTGKRPDQLFPNLKKTEVDA